MTTDRRGLTRSELLLITAVALGTLLNPLNTTMISVALARLQDEFRLTFGEVSWLISTYYLASAIGQPIMGKWSDLFGRKRVFLLGLTLVTLASCLAPLSPSFGWLIGFRIIQAFGSSALFPSGMGMIRSQITAGQAKALGVLSIFSGTSAAFGPSLGGLLLHYGDWQLIFLCNFPFIAGSFLLAWKAFPRDTQKPGRLSGMDWPGVALFSATIFLWLLFFLSIAEGANAWTLAAAAGMSIWFYRYELGRRAPFIDVAFLRNNVNVTLIYAQFILTNIAFYSIMFGIPSYLQQVQHMDPQQTGLVMLSIAGFSVLVTPLVSRWIDRKGSKPSLVVGTLSTIAGSLLLLFIRDAAPVTVIFPVLCVLGFANGFNNLGMQTVLYDFVKKEETGIASGLFMTSRFIGTILSSSLLAALFGKAISTPQLHSMAWACAALGVFMLLLTLRLPAARPGLAKE
ncbi:MFS transporter [Paenibacillus methanolicus]|uniref:Putative MFS family arabinose efflux permease n=1 Tax=Paenibacillus methanolicus TaxID=582686 RepID=A0A5S5C437_9BACL|nr:MFS transporter [Paenibacillus methanolicus]TYP73186.1 putative MFS family arabinose efflux permease [Paenibacillus methanolicus]